MMEGVSKKMVQCGVRVTENSDIGTRSDQAVVIHMLIRMRTKPHSSQSGRGPNHTHHNQDAAQTTLVTIRTRPKQHSSQSGHGPNQTRHNQDAAQTTLITLVWSESRENGRATFIIPIKLST